MKNLLVLSSTRRQEARGLRVYEEGKEVEQEDDEAEGNDVETQEGNEEVEDDDNEGRRQRAETRYPSPFEEGFCAGYKVDSLKTVLRISEALYTTGGGLCVLLTNPGPCAQGLCAPIANCPQGMASLRPTMRSPMADVPRRSVRGAG